MPQTEYIGGAVVADSVYLNGKIVGRDVEITLPAVEYATIEINAMGTYEKPIPQLINHMAADFSQIDPGLWYANLKIGEENHIEARWVQNVSTPTGGTKNVGFKAFMRGEAASLPELGVVVGEKSEAPSSMGLSKYSVVRDGKELFCIDRWADVNRVNGKDLNKSINSML